MELTGFNTSLIGGEMSTIEFETALLELAPVLIEELVKTIVNSFLEKTDLFSSRTCEIPEIDSENLIDFRDLMLSPKESVALGGSGESPFGQFAPLSMQFFQNVFMESNGGSTSSLPHQVVQALTKYQSNVLGTFHFTGAFPSAASSPSLELEATILKLENIDTINDPSIFFEPLDGQAYVTDNTMIIGSSSAVKGSITVIASSSDPSPFVDEIIIEFQTNAIMMVANLLVHVLESKLINFPVEDITDINCWAATLAESSSVQLSDISLEMDSSTFSWTVSCAYCTEQKVNQLVNSLQISNSMSIGFIQDILKKVFQSTEAHVAISDYISYASSSCPSARRRDLSSVIGGNLRGRNARFNDYRA
mmetsp:Transcript_5214/g.8075  ORF Transcript_5214/g.8075 Transcript_5214/m.8075 type:complete len:364 (-) Transcript_5214:29-1120(-)